MINFKSVSLERKIKSLIPNNGKKFILFFLTSSIFGKIIKISKIKSNLFGGKFDYDLVSDVEAARIFWGVWESAEIRFSKRFAQTDMIVELGSSIGVTLGVLSNLRHDTTFICVEASAANFKKLSRLQKQLSTNNVYSLINKAIAYGKDNVGFASTSTTGSKIDETIEDTESFVPAITLTRLLQENQVNDEYTLITDIEGAESEIFFKDEIALKNCVRIIAELEETSAYSIEEQINKLISVGFSITESYGNVFVFSRV